MAHNPRTVAGRRALVDELTSRMQHADSVAPPVNTMEYIIGSGINNTGVDRRVGVHLDRELRRPGGQLPAGRA